jgi:hypothetical protein
VPRGRNPSSSAVRFEICSRVIGPGWRLREVLPDLEADKRDPEKSLIGEHANVEKVPHAEST